MKLRSYISLTIITLLGFFQLQAQSTFNLNNPVDAAKAESGDVYFTLNDQAFEKRNVVEGAEFIFHTEKGERTFVITRRSEFVPGYISIIAADPETGENIFATTYHKGKLSGLYHPSHSEAQKISFDRNSGKHILSKNLAGKEEILACGFDGNATPVSHSYSSGIKQKNSPQNTAASLNEGTDDPITIDVLMVYTDAAETWASTSSHGDIDGVIAQALNLSQQALDNSEVNIEVRVVHSYKTPYNETTDGLEDSEARLRRLTQNDANPVFDGDEYNGHMEEVHSLRNQYGADIVSLLVRIEDTGGLGWRLSSTGGEAAFAFNLNRVQQVAENYT